MISSVKWWTEDEREEERVTVGRWGDWGSRREERGDGEFRENNCRWQRLRETHPIYRIREERRGRG